jgi:hypothetical protein
MIHEQRPLTARRLLLATDLDTKHGENDTNKRDRARQLGRLNRADVQL